MHSLVELYETNLLSLISQCLDNNSQIQTKLLQCLPSPQALYKRRFRHHLNAALVGFFLSDWRQHDEHLNLRPTRRALHPLLDRSNRQRCSEYLLDFRPVAFERDVKLSIRRNGSIPLYSPQLLSTPYSSVPNVSHSSFSINLDIYIMSST